MRTQCRVCGRFTSHDEYCEEHGKEYPECKHFMCPKGNPDFNICYPNTPHRCRRARAEGECQGFEKGEKVKLNRIINTKTGEVIASGDTGMELLNDFTQSDIYKKLIKEKGWKK